MVVSVRLASWLKKGFVREQNHEMDIFVFDSWRARTYVPMRARRSTNNAINNRLLLASFFDVVVWKKSILVLGASWIRSIEFHIYSTSTYVRAACI
jgi:hypothetical protein